MKKQSPIEKPRLEHRNGIVFAPFFRVVADQSRISRERGVRGGRPCRL